MLGGFGREQEHLCDVDGDGVREERKDKSSDLISNVFDFSVSDEVVGVVVGFVFSLWCGQVRHDPSGKRRGQGG